MFKLFDFFRQCALYEVVFRRNVIRYYTNNKRNIVVNDIEYVSSKISHSSVNFGSEKNQQVVNLVTDRMHELVKMCLFGDYFDLIEVKIFHYCKDTGEKLCVFMGRVVSCNLKRNKATFKLESFLLRSNRMCNSQNFSVLCPHDLYGEWCNATPVYISAQIISVNGNIIEIDGFSGHDPNNFILGKVVSGNTERMITLIDGNYLHLSAPLDSYVGQSVVIYYGCDKKINTCLNRFNNVVNFGGFKYLPARDPFKEGRIA